MSSYDAENILYLSLTSGTSRRGFMDGVAAASGAAAATVRDMVGVSMRRPSFGLDGKHKDRTPPLPGAPDV